MQLCDLLYINKCISKAELQKFSVLHAYSGPAWYHVSMHVSMHNSYAMDRWGSWKCKCKISYNFPIFPASFLCKYLPLCTLTTGGSLLNTVIIHRTPFTFFNEYRHALVGRGGKEGTKDE